MSRNICHFLLKPLNRLLHKDKFLCRVKFSVHFCYGLKFEMIYELGMICVWLAAEYGSGLRDMGRDTRATETNNAAAMGGK